MITIDTRAIEAALNQLTIKELRRATTRGLTAGSKVLLRSAKAGAPSKLIKRALKRGKTKKFKSRKGSAVTLGAEGALGYTAIGVPQDWDNIRPWMADYSTEFGNPGKSARSQQRKPGRRERARRPGWLANIADANTEAVAAAVSDAIKIELKL